MEVVKVKDIEDCLDGSFIKELLLSQEISKDFIFELAGKGNLEYFSDFARPFFKIRVSGVYDLKGVQGNKTIRIHLKSPEEYSIEDFIEFVEGIKCYSPEIS